MVVGRIEVGTIVRGRLVGNGSAGGVRVSVGSGTVTPGRVTPPPPTTMRVDETPTPGRPTVAPGTVTPPPPPTPIDELPSPTPGRLTVPPGNVTAPVTLTRGRPA